MVAKVAEANQIDVVLDSYIENSIKESTRASRSNDVKPITYVNLLLESPLPVELKRFWASSENNAELQILSREFFKQKTEEKNLTLVLSGYVIDGGGMQDCVMFKTGRIITMEKLKSSTEKAYSRLIQYLIETAKCECQRVVVIYNDTNAADFCWT